MKRFSTWLWNTWRAIDEWWEKRHPDPHEVFKPHDQSRAPRVLP